MVLVVSQKQNQSLANVNTSEERLQYINDHAQCSNTTKAYMNDQNHFVERCHSVSLVSMLATLEAVVLYMKALVDNGYKTSTIQRRISSISTVHQSGGHLTPTKHVLIRKMWQSIQNDKGTAQTHKKAAVLDGIKRWLIHCSKRNSVHVIGHDCSLALFVL